MTPTMLADLIVTAFEGGSNHWLNSAERVSLHTTSKIPWYSDAAFYQGDWHITLRVDDEPEPYHLDPRAVREAWDHLRADFPDRAQSILDESYDADDADVFLQLAVFNDVVYG